MNNRLRFLISTAVRMLACAVLCVAGATASAGEPRPVLVTEVHGSARAGQGQLALLDQIEPGAVLELEAGAVLVLFHTVQGQQFSLTGPGRFVTTADGVGRQGASGMVRIVSRDPVFAGVLRGRGQVAAGAVVRAGGADTTERIALSQPVLQWRARPHRGQWQLRFTDAAGQVLFATTLAQTSLALPPALQLQPGQHYLRELRWEGRDGVVQTDVAPVQALGADEEAELTRLAPPADADSATRVLYALYLHRLGIRGLAARIAPELNQLDPTQ